MKNRRTLLFTIALAIVLAGFTACEGLEGPTGTQAKKSVWDSNANLKISAAAKKGGQIAFVSLRDGNHEIYVMNADGTGQTRLTNHPAFDSEPVWSPNGKQIAFVSTHNGSPEIYVMNADGTDVTLLTNNLAINFQPAWSPIGKQIAFTSDRDGNFEIYVMNADGTGQTNLTNNSSADIRSTWSSNGKHIAFVSARDGNHEIYRMNADGSNPTNISNHPSSDDNPSWSPNGPNGKKIAFVSNRDDDVLGQPEIYVMNTDGTGQNRLTNNPAFDSEPAWSPNGKQIVWYRSFQTDTGENVNDIYVMNADGTAQTNLTDHPGADRDPDWRKQPGNKKRSLNEHEER